MSSLHIMLNFPLDAADDVIHTVCSEGGGMHHREADTKAEGAMQATQEITNSEDVIDSRDVIARIEYLAYLDDEPKTDENEDERNELAALRSLAAEAEGYAADWQYGETLIRESYFTEYAQQLAEDCGMIPSDLSWPCTCIDWEQAARELRMDYTEVDFDGVSYLIR